MKYHVHVYHVVSKADVEVDAKNKNNAMRVALAKVENRKARLGKSDCKYLATVPKKAK